MPRSSSRDPVELLREALDVRLVDDRLGERRARRPVALPVEVRVDHDALRDRVGVVLVVGLEVGVVGAVGHVRAARCPRSQRTGPSIDFAYGSISSLAGLKRMALARGRTGRARGSRSAGPGPTPGQVAVPVERGALGHLDARSRRPSSSNRHSSTRSAFSEKSEKFTPSPSHVGAERERPARPDAPLTATQRPGERLERDRARPRRAARACATTDRRARRPGRARRCVGEVADELERRRAARAASRASSSNSIASASPGGSSRRAAQQLAVERGERRVAPPA